LALDASSLTCRKVTVQGVSAYVVRADLKDRRVRVVTCVSRRFPGRAESFASVLARTGPCAAINGTFFGVRNLAPAGDLVVAGRPIYFGRLCRAFAINGDGAARLLPVFAGRSTGWEGFHSAVAAGPTLISNGRVRLAPTQEGFFDGAVFRSARRSAVGLTSGGQLLLVVTTQSVRLSALARFMQNLGAVDALNMDGGSSCALSFGGKTLVRPGRLLTNWILIYDDGRDVSRMAYQLLPAPYLAFRDRAAVQLASFRKQRFIVVPRHGAVIRDKVQIVVKKGGLKAACFAVISIDGRSKCVTNVFPHKYVWDAGARADGARMRHGITVEVFGLTGGLLAREEISVQTEPRREKPDLLGTLGSLITLPPAPNEAERSGEGSE
jgi:hypothetical protein